MKTKIHSQQKTPQRAASAPVPTPLQPRPFAVQAQPEQSSPEQQETLDSQEQQARAKCFSHKLENISIAPITPPPDAPKGFSLQAKFARDDQRFVDMRQPKNPVVLQMKANLRQPNQSFVDISQRTNPLVQRMKANLVQHQLVSEPQTVLPLVESIRQNFKVQAKLSIGQPGDKYEQEADRTAAKVMRMPAPTNQPTIQRQEKPDEELQRSPLASTITPLVQRQTIEIEEQVQTKRSLQSQTDASSNLENQLSRSKGGGSPLPNQVRSFMEPRFGFNFSQVRVHTDSEAVQLNRALGAQAFTHGSDIYYGAGKSPSVSDLTAHELTHVVQQTGRVQLKQTIQQKKTPNSANTVPVLDQRKVAEKVAADIQNDGLVVAVYAASDVHSVSEFENQATQFAEDHQAIGMSGSHVCQGGKAAMQMNDNLPKRLEDLNQGVNDLLAKYPDILPQSLVIPIKTLAIFTHGESYSLQAANKGGWIQSVEKWVEGIAPYLSPSPSILMYACSTAGTPTNKDKSKRTQGLPFAEAVRQELQKQLEIRYGENAGVAPEVWGHTVKGHTTANITLKGFSGGDVSSSGTGLVDEMGRKMTALAIENAGGSALIDTQRQKVATAARAAMVSVLRPRTGAKDPTNAYFREIPLIGINRVWDQLSTASSPNFADLGMTMEATKRMEEGLNEFRKRFETELSKLEKLVEKLLKLPAK